MFFIYQVLFLKICKIFATYKIWTETVDTGSCKILENNLNATFRAVVTMKWKPQQTNFVNIFLKPQREEPFKFTYLALSSS